VHVLIDYVKPREGEYEEKECVTITYGNQNKWVLITTIAWNCRRTGVDGMRRG
jgi:hypothetical protein